MQDCKRDLNLASERLLHSDLSVVVAKDGKIIAEKTGFGVGPLFDAIAELGEAMDGASVADRVVGRAAAFLLIHSRVVAVYTPVIGEEAANILRNYGLFVEFAERVPRILNKDKTDFCPMEKLVAGLDSPESAIARITEFLAEKRKHRG